jgi:hypothetical protein
MQTNEQSVTICITKVTETGSRRLSLNPVLRKPHYRATGYISSRDDYRNKAALSMVYQRERHLVYLTSLVDAKYQHQSTL